MRRRSVSVDTAVPVFYPAGKFARCLGTWEAHGIIHQVHPPETATRQRHGQCNILASKRFHGVLRGPTQALEGLGYKVFTKVLDSSSFGVPQQRKRLFLVSIREDSVRHEFQWPSPKTLKFNMGDFLDPIVPGDRPGRLPSSDRGRRHCMVAYRKEFADGNNPMKAPV